MAQAAPDKVIDIQGVGPVAFPSTMTPDQINAAAAKLYTDANPKHPPVDKAHSWIDTASDWLPTIGGAIGSAAGGTLGAMIGGAAARGYQTIYRNAPQIGPAIRDVARNVLTEPSATAKGFVEGAASGALDAGIQGGMQGAANLAGNALVAGAKRVAPALMQSALKPGIKSTLDAAKSGTVPPVVQTMLDQGVNVSRRGVDTLNALIGSSEKEIEQTIARATEDVAASAAPSTGKSALNYLTGTAMVDAKPAERMLLAKQRLLIQQMAKEAQQRTAQAAASKTAEVATATAPQTARVAALTEARDAIARRLASAGNRDPVGLGELMSLATHSPATFLLAVMEKSSAVKSMLARGLYQSAAKASGVPAAVIRTAVGAVINQPDQEHP